jgi:hypothetical protein
VGRWFKEAPLFFRTCSYLNDEDVHQIEDLYM